MAFRKILFGTTSHAVSYRDLRFSIIVPRLTCFIVSVRQARYRPLFRRGCVILTSLAKTSRRLFWDSGTVAFVPRLFIAAEICWILPVPCGSSLYKSILTRVQISRPNVATSYKTWDTTQDTKMVKAWRSVLPHPVLFSEPCMLALPVLRKAVAWFPCRGPS